MDFTNISFTFAFLAGLASFLSPCVFSLVPAYIGYLGGRSAASAASGRRAVGWLSAMGSPSSWFFRDFHFAGFGDFRHRRLLYSLRDYLARIGGLCHRFWHPHDRIYRIPFLEYDLRPQTTPDRSEGTCFISYGVFSLLAGLPAWGRSWARS